MAAACFFEVQHRLINQVLIGFTACNMAGLSSTRITSLGIRCPVHGGVQSADGLHNAQSDGRLLAITAVSIAVIRDPISGQNFSEQGSTELLTKLFCSRGSTKCSVRSILYSVEQLPRLGIEQSLSGVPCSMVPEKFKPSILSLFQSKQESCPADSRKTHRSAKIPNISSRLVDLRIALSTQYY